MVTDDGVVKLTDFGIAKDLDKTALTATGRTLGTAAYMAPEQIRGTPEVSHKTDLYALGDRALPDAHRPAAVRGVVGGRPDALPHERAGPPAQRQGRRDPQGARRPRRQADGQVADRPPLGRGGRRRDPQEDPRQGRAAARPSPWSGRPRGSTPRPPPGRPTTTVKKRRSRARSRPAVDERARAGRLPGLETAGLVLALVAVGGFIGYMLWPPGAPYLFKQAERVDGHRRAGTSGTRRSNEYIDPLDRRFPDNPYKATTRGWRDRIALAEVEGRARMLQSPVNTRLNQPNDKLEERWVEYFALVSAAEKRGDDLAEEAAWESWPGSTGPTTPRSGPGTCSRRSGREEPRRQIDQRRARVERLLAPGRRRRARRAGTDEAEGIRAEVVAKDGKFSSVADLLARRAPPARRRPTTPAPAPDRPSEPEPRELTRSD